MFLGMNCKEYGRGEEQRATSCITESSLNSMSDLTERNFDLRFVSEERGGGKETGRCSNYSNYSNYSSPKNICRRKKVGGIEKMSKILQSSESGRNSMGSQEKMSKILRSPESVNNSMGSQEKMWGQRIAQESKSQTTNTSTNSNGTNITKHSQSTEKEVESEDVETEELGRLKEVIDGDREMYNKHMNNMPMESIEINLQEMPEDISVSRGVSQSVGVSQSSELSVVVSSNNSPPGIGDGVGVGGGVGGGGGGGVRGGSTRISVNISNIGRGELLQEGSRPFVVDIIRKEREGRLAVPQKRRQWEGVRVRDLEENIEDNIEDIEERISRKNEMMGMSREEERWRGRELSERGRRYLQGVHKYSSLEYSCPERGAGCADYNALYTKYRTPTLFWYHVDKQYFPSWLDLPRSGLLFNSLRRSSSSLSSPHPHTNIYPPVLRNYSTKSYQRIKSRSKLLYRQPNKLVSVDALEREVHSKFIEASESVREQMGKIMERMGKMNSNSRHMNDNYVVKLGDLYYGVQKEQEESEDLRYPPYIYTSATQYEQAKNYLDRHTNMFPYNLLPKELEYIHKCGGSLPHPQQQHKRIKLRGERSSIILSSLPQTDRDRCTKIKGQHTHFGDTNAFSAILSNEEVCQVCNLSDYTDNNKIVICSVIIYIYTYIGMQFTRAC